MPEGASQYVAAPIVPTGALVEDVADGGSLSPGDGEHGWSMVTRAGKRPPLVPNQMILGGQFQKQKRRCLRGGEDAWQRERLYQMYSS